MAVTLNTTRRGWYPHSCQTLKTCIAMRNSSSEHLFLRDKLSLREKMVLKGIGQRHIWGFNYIYHDSLLKSTFETYFQGKNIAEIEIGLADMRGKRGTGGRVG